MIPALPNGLRTHEWAKNELSKIQTVGHEYFVHYPVYGLDQIFKRHALDYAKSRNLNISIKMVYIDRKLGVNVMLYEDHPLSVKNDPEIHNTVRYGDLSKFKKIGELRMGMMAKLNAVDDRFFLPLSEKRTTQSVKIFSARLARSMGFKVKVEETSDHGGGYWITRIS